MIERAKQLAEVLRKQNDVLCEYAGVEKEGGTLNEAADMLERLAGMLHEEIAFNSRCMEQFKEWKPTEQSGEPKLGEWIYDRPRQRPKCSRCGNRSVEHPFCHHCGAAMRGRLRYAQD